MSAVARFPFNQATDIGLETPMMAVRFSPEEIFCFKYIKGADDLYSVVLCSEGIAGPGMTVHNGSEAISLLGIPPKAAAVFPVYAPKDGRCWGPFTLEQIDEVHEMLMSAFRERFFAMQKDPAQELRFAEQKRAIAERLAGSLGLSSYNSGTFRNLRPN